MRAERLRYEAAKARRQYLRAKKARKRAGEKDRARLAIEAHNRKMIMREKLALASLKAQ